MRLTKLRLLATVSIIFGCGHVSAPVDVPAPAARAIADYASTTDTLYIRENEGRLEAILRKAVFPLEKVLVSPDSAIVEGQVLRRRRYAEGTFRMTPTRPVADLRREALAATPPAQPDTLLAPDLVELNSLDPTIRYDIRYASSNNFMGDVFYSSARAFLQRPAAEAVLRAHRELKTLGYGLLIHDAYRPWYVTKMFWDATPDSLRDFVANPAAGSRHNRGAAVDLTLYDLETGAPVEMPSGYDEFSERALPNYPGGTSAQREMRALLRRIMEDSGFEVYPFEWWHFDYRDWRKYPLANVAFEDIVVR